MKVMGWSWDALLIASIVVVASLCVLSPKAVVAEDEVEPEGKIVRISPDPASDSAETSLETETRIVEQPTYWIGISGRDVQSPVLRTQFQLAEDMGVVIEQVVPDSPADKAGLQKHDIILRANGDAVHSMQVLQDHVRTHEREPLELKIIRLSKEETIVVVPEERPEEFAGQREVEGEWNGLEGWNGMQGDADGLRKLLEQLQRRGGLQGGMRMLGPGMVFQGQQFFDIDELPGGVTVSVERADDGPAKITVKRGDENWEITGDDPEALEQLPEDLRPFVERMLQKQGLQQGGFNFEAELENFLPQALGNFRGDFEDEEEVFAARNKKFLMRMERMEQELQELRKKLSEQE